MPAPPRIALTPGEPAGIGPDICLSLATGSLPAQLIAIADPDLLAQRSTQLGLEVTLSPYDHQAPAAPHRPGYLPVIAVPLAQPSVAGQLASANAKYVLETLRIAADGCNEGRFDAMVTAPVHKGVINDGGIAFSGHTEFLAQRVGGDPVMLLAAGNLRVALATTHLPLRDVPSAITAARLERVLRVLDHDLRLRFGIVKPQIRVCGLNPHAGEGGHLGREEIEVIEPTLERLRSQGLQLTGPLPADTLFTPRGLDGADAVLAMYHDQGLPVLKHVGFGRAVNITLGLPIIRTSVDHGTALDLAGSGQAESGSLAAAVKMAAELCVVGHDEGDQ